MYALLHRFSKTMKILTVIFVVLVAGSYSDLIWNRDRENFYSCSAVLTKSVTVGKTYCFLPENETTEDGYQILLCKYKHAKLFKYALLSEHVVEDNRTLFCIGLHSITKDYGPTGSTIMEFNHVDSIGAVEILNRYPENDRIKLEFMFMGETYDKSALSNSPATEDFWDDIRKDVPGYWLKGLNIYFQPIQGDSRWAKPFWIQKLQNMDLEVLEIHNLPIKDVINIPYLKKLRRLILRQTSIGRLNAVNNVPNLEELDLTGNKLQRMPKLRKYSLLSLRKLILSKNSIVFIHSALGIYDDIERETHRPRRKRPRTTTPYPSMEPFDNLILQSLEYLDLSYNLISDIGYSQLNPVVPKLQYLILSHCAIEYLPDNVEDPFENMPSLKHLDLSGNKITKLENANLFSYRSLVKIDFSKNGLTNWPVLEQCNVKTLDLSNNKLSAIENLGSYNTSVEKLLLSHNNITQWKNSNLFSLSDKAETWVENINFSHNFITVLSKEMRRSLEPVKTIDMGANRIDCAQCSLPELKDWLRKNTKKVLNLGTRQTLACDSPAAEKGQNVFDSDFYLTACEGYKKFVIGIAVPIVFILTIVTLCALMVFRYRFELAYMLFLFKQRNSGAVDMYEASIYDAFICYSGSDRRFVLKTLMPLIENGNERYRLCLHDRDFLLGTHITRNIVHAIDKSRRTVIVLSNEFLKSRWCRWEVDMANNRLLEESRNFLVLIELEPLDRNKIPRHVKMLMASRTYLEWPRDNSDQTLEHVRKRLTKALGKSIFQATHQIKEVNKADILL